ncbi:RDD family protein [Glycomyces buryatensis]|nr:RDD family protein [Glycomyces buryatensis]
MTQPPFLPGPPDHGPGPVASDPGAASPESASPAPGIGRRIGGRAIDFGVWTAVFVLLATLTYNTIAESLTTISGGEIVRVLFSLLTTGGDVGEAAESFGLSAWRMIVSKIQLSIFVLIAFHLAYELAAGLWKGRTVGRMILDMRLEGRRRPGVGVWRSAVRALITVVCTGGLYGLAWVALLHGSFAGGFALWVLSVAALVAYLVTALVGRERRSLADLVAGTRVVRAGVYAKAGQTIANAAQASASAARQAADATRTGATGLADQVPVQRARETGARIITQASESEQAQRLRDLGTSAKDRAVDTYRRRRGDGQPPIA